MHQNDRLSDRKMGRRRENVEWEVLLGEEDKQVQLKGVQQEFKFDAAVGGDAWSHAAPEGDVWDDTVQQEKLEVMFGEKQRDQAAGGEEEQEEDE